MNFTWLKPTRVESVGILYSALIECITTYIIWSAPNISADITMLQANITSQQQTSQDPLFGLSWINLWCLLHDFFGCERDEWLKRSATLLTSDAVWSSSLRYHTSGFGLALWFKCNFILWENILTKRKLMFGVRTHCPHGKWDGS